MKLSPRTLDVVRLAHDQAVRELGDAREYLARSQQRLAEAQTAVAQAAGVVNELAATLAAHAAAVADESEVHQVEREARLQDKVAAGLRAETPAATNAELSEPLRGKEGEAPARGPRGEWVCCGGPHTAQERNPRGHAVSCQHYGDGAGEPGAWPLGGVIPQPRQES